MCNDVINFIQETYKTKELLSGFIKNKREIAHKYQEWGQGNDMDFITKWLNVIIMQDKQQRGRFIEVSNSSNITNRPVWWPMHELAMNQDCQKM